MYNDWHNLQNNLDMDKSSLDWMNKTHKMHIGERNPLVLAALRDQRCKNSEETIARSLHGNYRPEHLFSLKQAVDLYGFYQGQIAECDQAILTQLATFDVASDSDKDNKPPTKIAGIDSNGELKIISEIGIDMSCWKSATHFASWLGCARHQNQW